METREPIHIWKHVVTRVNELMRRVTQLEARVRELDDWLTEMSEDQQESRERN
jgi:hypothetical protein